MKSRHLVFNKYGSPSKVLQLEEFSLKKLCQGEVLLEIQASPINPADLNFIEGTYGIKPELPATAGIECSALVLESRSEKFNPGDLVIPISNIGGWSNHAVTNDTNLIRLPHGIDPLQAAMLKVNPATAFLLLTYFEKLATNDWVVLNASNSGVGQCLVQLASGMHIQTICFLRNVSLIPTLKTLGATHVFEDSPAGFSDARETLGDARAKLAFNTVGGDSALRLMKLLDESGTHITYGAMARKPLTIPNGSLIFNDIRLRGLWVTKWIESCNQKQLDETYQKLAALVISGSLHQSVDSTFRLADFQKAFTRITAPKRSGKLLFLKE